MLTYETLRELFKLVLLEKIRDAVFSFCGKCRRSKKQRKVTYGVNDKSCMLHKSKDCRSLRGSKKDVLKIKLCMHCGADATDTEDA